MLSQQSKEWSLKNERYRYTLFYRKDTGELYAYTDNKILAKSFKLTRKESIFIIEQKMLSSSDLKDIYNNIPDTLILPYRFDIGKTTIILPITMREKLELEHTVSQVTTVSIYLAASINPEIFTSKIQEILKKLNYVNIYKDCNSSRYNSESLKADFLTCFLTLYGDTMKERW